MLKALGLLNKIVPQTFDKLSVQFIDLAKNLVAERQSELVDRIFNKVTHELDTKPHSSLLTHYAVLVCFKRLIILSSWRVGC